MLHQLDEDFQAILEGGEVDATMAFREACVANFGIDLLAGERELSPTFMFRDGGEL